MTLQALCSHCDRKFYVDEFDPFKYAKVCLECDEEGCTECMPDDVCKWCEGEWDDVN